MKKVLFIILFSIFTVFGFANDGDVLANQIKHKFVTTSFGHTKWGLYNLPDGTATKYPVIVFMHGVGESGSTEADLSKLLKHGTPWLLSQEVNLSFTNPINGRQSKFISIAIQNPTWSTEITDVFYALKNDPILKDRVDWRGVFVTGLSAGGQNCMNSLLTSINITDSIRGIVPMSSAGYNSTNIMWAVGKPVWAFHGLQDATTPYQVTQGFINIVGGRWTQLPITHSGWNNIYTVVYKENINGFLVNIYEWMLMQMPTQVLALRHIMLNIVNNILHFTVNDEENVAYYSVEESTDGINFNIIKKILPSGLKSYTVKL